MNKAEFRNEHEREAIRVRKLIANATTPALKARLLEDAEKHEQLAEQLESFKPQPSCWRLIASAGTARCTCLCFFIRSLQLLSTSVPEIRFCIEFEGRCLNAGFPAPCSHPVSSFEQLRHIEAKTAVDKEFTVTLTHNDVILLAQKPYNFFDRFRRVLRRGRFMGP